MEEALDDIKSGTSISAASRTFNVPYATLHARVNGKYNIDVKPGPSSILTKSEEKDLVNWIFHLSKCGFPVTKEDLLDSVQNIVLKMKKKTPFTNGRPSKHWFQAFLKKKSRSFSKRVPKFDQIKSQYY